MLEWKGDVALNRCLQIVHQNMNVRTSYKFLVLFIKWRMGEAKLMSHCYILVNPVLLVHYKSDMRTG